jgi:hypothetical protein
MQAAMEAAHAQELKEQQEQQVTNSADDWPFIFC